MRFLSLLFIAALFCCKAANNASSDQATLEKLVETEIGANATIEKNNSSTFALASRTDNRFIEYIIIRLSDLKIVVKDKIQGSVTWSGDMAIKVMKTPGMVKMNSRPDDNVKIINLENYLIHNR